MSTETQTKRICAVCDYVFTLVLVGGLVGFLKLIIGPGPWWIDVIVVHYVTAMWFIDTA